MHILRKIVIASAIVATSLAASTGIASADSRMFVAHLYGGNERPVAGDPDAYGLATVVLPPVGVAGQVCYSIILFNAAVATAAHIHSGAAGVVGGVVLALPVPAIVPTRIGNCIGAAAGTIAAIRANPQNFYVNVHNAVFPGGAARGQLQ
jgi:hypothetical protein